MRWFRPNGYSVLMLLLFQGIISVVLAWTSYGLITVAMANAGYLREFGLMAVFDGGLLQLLQITGKGVICLICYVGFKGIEYELIHRWRGGSGH